VLVAHVRKATVGKNRVANCHPFVRGRWVFAHNGTIDDCERLRPEISPARAAETVGETDSELFFAWLLTRLDEAGVTTAANTGATDAVLRDALRRCRARRGFGSLNFLLSEGTSCWVHRFGRSLFLLERGAGGRRADALLVASEPTTDEAWRELPDGVLVGLRLA
jgi:glutamine amidotransferase